MTLADGKSNKGRVQAYDGPIHVADAANYLMFHKPELGIKDPYELNEDQYKAALELLRGQRQLVSRYWHDAFIQIDDFKNEGVVASGSWPFQVNLLKADQPIASVFPKEGVTGWADTTMLHAEAKNPNCAYMWMEHSLNTKLQGDLAAWFGSVPSVPAACKGNKLLTDQGCANQGYNSFERISFWKTPTSKCASQNNACFWAAADFMTIAVTLEAVSCVFGSGAQTVRAVDHVDLTIEGGEFFTLLGPSGSGKTTFVKLIQRLYDVTGGRILVDGVDIRDFTQASLRGQIAIVQQEPILFHRSLADNIAYSRPGASRAEVIEAAKLASAHEFIETLPKGYETMGVIAERGTHQVLLRKKGIYASMWNRQREADAARETLKRHAEAEGETVRVKLEG
eukprot:gene40475-53520_t